jgi:hypothetical protein
MKNKQTNKQTRKLLRIYQEKPKISWVAVHMLKQEKKCQKFFHVAHPKKMTNNVPFSNSGTCAQIVERSTGGPMNTTDVKEESRGSIKWLKKGYGYNIFFGNESGGRVYVCHILLQVRIGKDFF